MKTKLKLLTIAEGDAIQNQYPFAQTGPHCNEQTEGKNSYSCTREKDHDGPHVGHIPGPTAVVIWDQEIRG